MRGCAGTGSSGSRDSLPMSAQGAAPALPTPVCFLTLPMRARSPVDATPDRGPIKTQRGVKAKETSVLQLFLFLNVISCKAYGIVFAHRSCLQNQSSPPEDCFFCQSPDMTVSRYVLMASGGSQWCLFGCLERLLLTLALLLPQNHTSANVVD